ncbi:unnamed protein product [Rhizophagus irregularis]|nr:unnamed protein product [Rhizophagus irregularis]
MGARLLKKWNDLDLDDCNRPENLRECELIHHDLLQYDPGANRPPTREEIEEDRLEEFCRWAIREIDPVAGSGPRTQAFRKGNKSKNLMNEEFEHLGEIKKGQERPKEDLVFREQELGLAVKRRAVAIYNAKVPKFHLNNGKFLLNDKPGNENKKSSRSDWLRNKQIIVYNWQEIDDYLSDAFE